MRADKGAVVFFALPRAAGASSAASLGLVRQGVSASTMDSSVMMSPCTAKSAGRDTVMLCLLTNSVDACAKRAVAGGRARVVQPPQANPRFGIYNALLRDPDGYLVELQQFLEPEEHARFGRVARRQETGSDTALPHCSHADLSQMR